MWWHLIRCSEVVIISLISIHRTRCLIRHLIWIKASIRFRTKLCRALRRQTNNSSQAVIIIQSLRAVSIHRCIRRVKDGVLWCSMEWTTSDLSCNNLMLSLEATRSAEVRERALNAAMVEAKAMPINFKIIIRPFTRSSILRPYVEALFKLKATMMPCVNYEGKILRLLLRKTSKRQWFQLLNRAKKAIARFYCTNHWSN